MKPLLIAVLATLVALLTPSTVARGAGPDCVGAAGVTCGVSSGGGQFHGLLAVVGSPWVLELAADGGSRPGCGDCSWTIVLACPDESPQDPGSLAACAGASNAGVCRRGQLLYRVYLTTDAVTDRVEGTVCIGGADQAVPVGDRAAGDVARYLRDVTPPDLVVATRPRRATLAGLPTYFTARRPASLGPAPFGGPGITEAIVLQPDEVSWRWGDGTRSEWFPPGQQATHAYHRGGTVLGELTTRWSATYTITYAETTFGPYDATGTLTRRQPFRLPVRTSTPVLVSR